MRRRLLLAAIAVGVVLLWTPVLRPISKGGIILVHVYSTVLFDRNLAALITPPPRYEETREVLGGVAMRVSWWRPGWGERHPTILFVNGATPAGNDLAEIRLISEAVARAGYLVMLPEFLFLKEDRLEGAAIEQIDDAFAALRGHPSARPPAGAFGFSVGGGVLLAAAGRGSALREAAYLGVLGAYYDIDTYLASVVSGEQRSDGSLREWEASDDARRRLPIAAAGAIADPSERERLVAALQAVETRPAGEPPAELGEEASALWRALAATGYEEALARTVALPPGVRRALDRISPHPAWTEVRAPVFWLHDAKDHYVPVAEAEAALAAPRPAGGLHLSVSRLLQHGEPVGESARREGAGFWVAELLALLRFAIEVIRAAD